MSQPPPSRVEPVAGAGALGMKLLVISLAVLFASAIASFWVVRGDVDSWTGAEEGFRIPVGVGAGTAALALLSLASERAARRFDSGAAAAGGAALKLAFAFAVLFLAAQAWNWQELIAAHLPPGAKSLYAFNFYLLTGLHALHVLGGLVFHVVVLMRAGRGLYGGAGADQAARATGHDGPRNLAVYWHFLAATWVALVATLLLGADPSLTAEGIIDGFVWITGAALAVFAACWLKVELALLRAPGEGPVSALIGLFPPVAFLRGFMKADELGVRGWLFWWTAAFGVALTAGSTALAVAMTAAR